MIIIPKLNQKWKIVIVLIKISLKNGVNNRKKIHLQWLESYWPSEVRVQNI